MKTTAEVQRKNFVWKAFCNRNSVHLLEWNSRIFWGQGVYRTSFEGDLPSNYFYCFQNKIFIWLWTLWTLLSSRYPLLLQDHLKLQKDSSNLKRIYRMQTMLHDFFPNDRMRQNEIGDSKVDCQMVFFFSLTAESLLT